MKRLLQSRSELAQVMLLFRQAFYQLAGFSAVINLLMLLPSIYMLQIYDRVLHSRNETTLLMLTLMVVGLYG
jgi:ATP-binding cassette subfamily C exporter for protease/lipase